jgi:hypothetical protein
MVVVEGRNCDIEGGMITAVLERVKASGDITWVGIVHLLGAALMAWMRMVIRASEWM